MHTSFKFAIYTFETEHWNRILFINKNIEQDYIKTFTNIIESINCTVNTTFIKYIECNYKEAKINSVYISVNAVKQDICDFVDHRINAYNIFQKLLTEPVKEPIKGDFIKDGPLDLNKIYPINLQKIPEQITIRKDLFLNNDLGDTPVILKSCCKDIKYIKDISDFDQLSINNGFDNRFDPLSINKGFDNGFDNNEMQLKSIYSCDLNNSIKIDTIRLVIYHTITDMIIIVDPSKIIDKILEDFEELELIYTVKNNIKLLKVIQAICLDEKFENITDAKNKVNDLANIFDTFLISKNILPTTSIVNSITEYINFNYIITSNKNDKIKAHVLLTEILQNVNGVPEERKLQNDLPSILSNMNIHKRRLKDGIYYYGLINKSDKKIKFSKELTDDTFAQYLNERKTLIKTKSFSTIST